MGAISLKYKSKSGNLTAPGDVDPGAMVPIATVTVGAGGQSAITFSSIPQNYEHLQLRGVNRSAAPATYGTNDVVFLRINSDLNNNYSHHYLVGGDGPSGNSIFSGGFGNVSWLNLGWNATSTSPSNVFSTSINDILDYSNTNKAKTVKTFTGYETNSGNGFGFNCIWFGSGAWYSTNAVTSLTLTYSGGNFAQHSTFALYGIKKAGA